LSVRSALPLAHNRLPCSHREPLPGNGSCNNSACDDYLRDLAKVFALLSSSRLSLSGTWIMYLSPYLLLHVICNLQIVIGVHLLDLVASTCLPYSSENGDDQSDQPHRMMNQSYSASHPTGHFNQSSLLYTCTRWN
jgi:hypothetical protein